jgi:hypothetical protein
MERKEVIERMDELLSACKTCDKRDFKKWGSPSFNRFMKYCNSQCPTGKQLHIVAEDLDAEVRARRKQKKGVSA